MAKSKLTPQVLERICQSLALGSYLEVSFRAAGIHPGTGHSWLAQGEKQEEGPFREFYEAVGEAQAAAEERLVGLISNAAVEDWRAAECLLSRKFPERWAGKARVELTGAGGKPVQFEQAPDISGLSLDELKQLRDLVTKTQRPQIGRGDSSDEPC